MTSIIKKKSKRIQAGLFFISALLVGGLASIINVVISGSSNQASSDENNDAKVYADIPTPPCTDMCTGPAI